MSNEIRGDIVKCDQVVFGIREKDQGGRKRLAEYTAIAKRTKFRKI